MQSAVSAQPVQADPTGDLRRLLFRKSFFSSLIMTHQLSLAVPHCPCAHEAAPAPTGRRARAELAAVSYQGTLLGAKGPRRMLALIPRLDVAGRRAAFCPAADAPRGGMLDKCAACGGLDWGYCWRSGFLRVL